MTLLYDFLIISVWVSCWVVSLAIDRKYWDVSLGLALAMLLIAPLWVVVSLALESPDFFREEG